MYTQELLVEQGSEGQAVEGLHAGVIHPLRVFNFTCGKHKGGCRFSSCLRSIPSYLGRNERGEE